ncbi:unnamed protein product [Protopolystoma xenopodis]|uniref:Uncharacterized protein n=1 Tax=Protopolystoma xenopodis TaxID=117903 RepID=A0A448WBA6_9PLAT|nr:unnamed protein product [Protopolystoma xenopodis]
MENRHFCLHKIGELTRTLLVPKFVDDSRSVKAVPSCQADSMIRPSADPATMPSCTQGRLSVYISRKEPVYYNSRASHDLPPSGNRAASTLKRKYVHTELSPSFPPRGLLLNFELAKGRGSPSLPIRLYQFERSVLMHRHLLRQCV